MSKKYLLYISDERAIALLEAQDNKSRFVTDLLVPSKPTVPVTPKQSVPKAPVVCKNGHALMPERGKCMTPKCTYSVYA